MGEFDGRREKSGKNNGSDVEEKKKGKGKE